MARYADAYHSHGCYSFFVYCCFTLAAAVFGIDVGKCACTIVDRLTGWHLHGCFRGGVSHVYRWSLVSLAHGGRSFFARVFLLVY